MNAWGKNADEHINGRLFMNVTQVPEMTRTLKISNEFGVHARSAAKIARVAVQACGQVFLVKDEMSADAKNILDTMGLYCPCGTVVTVRITDPADMEVLEQLASLIEAGFGE